MEAAFLWVWESEPVHTLAHAHGSPSNDLNHLERDMHAAFVVGGRDDFAEAFGKRHKYARTLRCKIDANYLWLRREAFLGAEAGPRPKDDEEWIEMALGRYGEDEGFRRYKARLEEKANGC